MGRFEGKTAIVTGAAGGIGEEYAKALAAEGSPGSPSLPSHPSMAMSLTGDRWAVGCFNDARHC